MQSLITFYRLIEGDLSPGRTSKTVWKEFLASLDPVGCIVITEEKNSEQTVAIKKYFFSEVPLVNGQSCPADAWAHHMDKDQTLTRCCCTEDADSWKVYLYFTFPIERLSATLLGYYYYKERSITLKEQAIVQLASKVLSSHATAKKRSLLVNIQAWLLRLLQNLRSQQKASDPYATVNPTDPSACYQVLYQGLEGILSYMETYFLEFLDSSRRVSFKRCALLRARVDEAFNQLQASLQQYPVPWQRVLLHPLENLACSNNPSIETFQFISFYFNHLQELCERETLTLDRIIAHLIETNLNSTEACRFIVKNKQPADKEISLVLAEMQFRLEMMTTRPHRFDCLKPGIKEQLHRWIDHARAQKFQSSWEVHEPEPSEKEVLPLTVAQLSLFARAVVESGLSQGGPKEILQFIARNFRTLRQDSISIGSLQSKYYSVDTTTKLSLRKYLKSMLNLIDKV